MSEQESPTPQPDAIPAPVTAPVEPDVKLADTAEEATQAAPPLPNIDVIEEDDGHDHIEPLAAFPDQAEEAHPVEEDAPILADHAPNLQVEDDLARPISTPMSAKEREAVIESLYMPSDSPERMIDYYNRSPNLDADMLSNADFEWGQAFQGGMRATPKGSLFQGLQFRKGSKWRRSMATSKGPLAAGLPKDKPSDNKVVSGEAAVRQIYHAIGLIGMYQIPLWHSGFWVTLRQPPDSAIMELQHRIAQEKVEMGRQTSALAFSNMSVYMAEHVLDFVMKYIHSHSIDIPANQSIRPFIKTQDLQTLAWGMASTIWVKGFKHTRALLTTDGKVGDDGQAAQRTVTEILNLNRMLFVDNEALTEWQKNHMSSRRAGSMKTEMIERYQKEFPYSQGKQIKLNDYLSLDLKIPSLDEYIASGTRWVSFVEEMVNRALGTEHNDAKRNDYIDDQGRTTIMRQYSHWVERVHVNGKVIEDETSIENALAAAGQDGDVRDAYIKEIKAFIDTVMVAYVCVPAINREEHEVYKSHPHLVPIDAMLTFFILIGQKVLLIQTRQVD